MLFEKVTAHEMYSMFAKVKKGFALNPIVRHCHFFVDHGKLLFTAT
jgi:hypothetical protein